MPVAPGTKLGQYEVQDFLGQGAMGLVYRAYHPQLERTGAVKVLQAISPDADTVARFRHEAQAIAQLRHPNIVNVYDFGEYQGTPYMIVEYVPGGSLAGKMSLGLLDRATALKYLRGIAAGLDYAHSHGVVHRDVKPANVLLTTEDVPVLADFGLAKLLQGTSLKSMTGVTTGTPAYMAPEQVTGSKVGPAADRYSLATIAYEMLTGVIPFDGLALMELLYAQVHRDAEAPSARVPSLPPRVDAVIMRGLAKDPAARWESCTAFVDALGAAIEGNGVPSNAVAKTMVMDPPAVASTVPIAAKVARAAPTAAAPATEVMLFPTPSPASPATPAPATSSKPRRHLKRNAATAAAAVIVLLAIMGTCALMAQATTLNVTPASAARGDVVTVRATHVPANQVGEIQLWSIVHTFPFRSDANGNVTVYMSVPQDVALGDHTVKICWSNSCHQQTSLRVVARVAEVSPSPGKQSPGSSPSPNASPTAGSTASPTSTPHSSPRPTSNPTSQPTSQPTSTPTSQPKPTPSPTPNPCPPVSGTQFTAPAANSTLLLSGLTNLTVAGKGFTPSKTVTITYTSPGGSNAQTSTTVGSSGTFSTTMTVPGGLGTAHLYAADSCGRSASESVTVVL